MRSCVSTSTVVDGAGLVADHERAVTTASVAWGAAGVAAALVVGALVMVPFTNFDDARAAP